MSSRYRNLLVSTRLTSLLTNLSKIEENVIHSSFYDIATKMEFISIRGGFFNRKMPCSSISLVILTPYGTLPFYTKSVEYFCGLVLLIFSFTTSSLTVYAEDTAGYTQCRNETFVHYRFQRTMDGLAVWVSGQRFKIREVKCTVVGCIRKWSTPSTLGITVPGTYTICTLASISINVSLDGSSSADQNKICENQKCSCAPPCEASEFTRLFCLQFCYAAS